MKFSTVNSTRIGSRDKSFTDVTKSPQDLQTFSLNSAIASSSNCDLDKVSVVPLPPLQQDRRSHQQLSFFTLTEPAATVSISPCPKCGSAQAKQIAGTGPHHAGLRCVSCDRFIKWLPYPKAEPFSNQGGQH